MFHSKSLSVTERENKWSEDMYTSENDFNSDIKWYLIFLAKFITTPFILSQEKWKSP